MLPHITPLHDFHTKHRAKMAQFAGYDMPIEYAGIKTEHLHVRQNCGIFDVSHMGQFILEGEGAAKVLSHMTPTNFKTAKIGTCYYTVLTNVHGGIEDDLIITKLAEEQFYVVVNAARKNLDEAWILENIEAHPTLTFSKLGNRVLIAVQGPKAESVLQKYLGTGPSHLKKMQCLQVGDTIISRTGYTGEDGFEISMLDEDGVALWHALAEDENVMPIGLGARDSLRLEAGFPLYGHDLTTETTPIEASLGWIISKDHETFIGAEIILDQKHRNNTDIKRIGITLKGKGILREGYKVLSTDGLHIGKLTSGGYCPTTEKSIGQAYIHNTHAEIGTPVLVEIRGKLVEAKLTGFRFL